MRKLLNTLFVTTENLYLALENENIVVLDGSEKKGQFPLGIFETILCFTYKGASPALMGACAARGISLCFLTPKGRFLSRSVGAENGNVLLRREQYRIADDEGRCVPIARNFIYGKTHNARWILERSLRDHALRIEQEKVEEVSKNLKEFMEEILSADSLETLRGEEGMASALYFSVFDQLILNQKEDFWFESRNRRPPMDRVNALLSFLYTLLANDCAAALEAVGLDAYVGFMHRDRPGRSSLALDLMEELRSPLADRMALTLINTRAVNRTHFERQNSGAVLLNDEGRKIVLNAWQNRKKETITHPYINERIGWGLVPYVQALLLSRYLRRDLDGYPPFLWK